MFRFLFGLFFLTSCSLGVIQSGGEKGYVYSPKTEYTSEELKELSPHAVTTKSRNPQKGTLEELFSKNQKPLTRIGIVVFETTIQPTRGGLSGQDLIYVSAQGKQLLTEKMLSMWEQSLPILGEEIVYVPVSEIKKSKTLPTYGAAVKEHIVDSRTALDPDDIFFLPPGKNTATETVLNPRGMRDLSLALVPAAELMAGPKFSEHHRHALNDVAKELNLDAVLIVMSEINWTTAHIDKHSGESYPEVATVKIAVTTAVPFTSYHERLNKLGETRDLPKQTISYRYHETKVSIPISISVPAAEQTFTMIQEELLNPVLKTYNDFSQMVQWEMIKEIKKTHQ